MNMTCFFGQRLVRNLSSMYLRKEKDRLETIHRLNYSTMSLVTHGPKGHTVLSFPH